jgi:hypothetical protein
MNTDINRRIAELLEPEPKHKDVMKGAGPWVLTLSFGGHFHDYKPRNFSGDWADAGWLLEEMKRRGWNVAVDGNDPHDPWEGQAIKTADCGICSRIDATAYNTSGPAAIAEAALGALEEEHDKKG